MAADEQEKQMMQETPRGRGKPAAGARLARWSIWAGVILLALALVALRVSRYWMRANHPKNPPATRVDPEMENKLREINEKTIQERDEMNRQLEEQKRKLRELQDAARAATMPATR